MDRPKVLTNGESKFRNDVISKTRNYRKKGKSKLKSKQSKKSIECRKRLYTDKEQNDHEVISKTEAKREKYKMPGTSKEEVISISESSAPNTCARTENQTEGFLEKSVDESLKYDREKLGSELWLALHKQAQNIGNLTSDELQHIVAEFSLAHNLDVEKVNLVLKDFVESRKRAIDGLNHLLEQQILESLNSVDPEKSVTSKELEVDTSIRNDQETDMELQDETGTSQESDSFRTDSPIPIIRPRSPLILFADDLSLDNILDEGIERVPKQGILPFIDLFTKDKDGDT